MVLVKERKTERDLLTRREFQLEHPARIAQDCFEALLANQPQVDQTCGCSQPGRAHLHMRPFIRDERMILINIYQNIKTETLR